LFHAKAQRNAKTQ